MQQTPRDSSQDKPVCRALLESTLSRRDRTADRLVGRDRRRERSQRPALAAEAVRNSYLRRHVQRAMVGQSTNVRLRKMRAASDLGFPLALSPLLRQAHAHAQKDANHREKRNSHTASRILPNRRILALFQSSHPPCASNRGPRSQRGLARPRAPQLSSAQLDDPSRDALHGQASRPPHMSSAWVAICSAPSLVWLPVEPSNETVARSGGAISRAILWRGSLQSRERRGRGLPPMKPAACTKMQPSMPDSRERASSRTPRHLRPRTVPDQSLWPTGEGKGGPREKVRQ